MQQLKLLYDEMNGVEKALAIGLLILGLICFFSNVYIDILVVNDHSYSFWNSIFGKQGKIYLQKYLAESVFYIVVILIFAIWNFPIWVVMHFTEMSPMHWLPILWSKLLVLVFCAVTLIYIYKIFGLVGIEKKQFIFWAELSLSSLVFFLPVFTIWQYDIGYICFFIVGLYYYMNHKNGIALAMWALAITYKGFAFVYIAVAIFLKRKEIWRSVCELLITLSGVLGISILASVIGATSERAFDQGMFSSLTSTYSSSSVSLVLTIILVLFGYAYENEITSPRDYLHKLSWIVFGIFSAYFIFSGGNSYWICNLAPLAGILLIMNISELLSWLWIIINGVYVYIRIRVQDWVFGHDSLFDKLILQNVYVENRNRKWESLSMLISDVIPGLFDSVFATVLLVATIFFMKNTRIQQKEETFCVRTMQNTLLLGQFGILTIYYLGTILLLFI